MGNNCCDAIRRILNGDTSPTSTRTAAYQPIKDYETRSNTQNPSINAIAADNRINNQPNAPTMSTALEIPKRPYQDESSDTYSMNPNIGATANGNKNLALNQFSNATAKSAFYMNYELREEVGVGSTSKCYRCCRKSDGKEFACKVIDKRQVEMKFSGLLDQFNVEIKVLKSLNHPNIIHLEDTFESSDRIYMVMELMNGGELFDYVVDKGTLSEEEASVIVRKITSAVAHMHNQNIIHRDLKPENLLLTGKGADAEIKLIDFGLAKIMFDEVASSFLGTKGYLAPEMLQRHSYDKAIDMWALGVIVFVLLCGCLPFDDDSSRIASDAVARKKFALRFPKWANGLSASAKDLLHNLLEIDPKRRYTADQALNHPWVSGKTVQLNNYLQSPCILQEKRKEMRSPLPSTYIQDILDKVSNGNSATARATYGNQYGAGNPRPPDNTTVTYYGRGGGMCRKLASLKCAQCLITHDSIYYYVIVPLDNYGYGAVEAPRKRKNSF